MFEVPIKEVRKGDLVLTKDSKKFKVRDVYDRLICLDGTMMRRVVVEVALGDQLFLDDIDRVHRKYQPGDWRAA